MYVTFYMYVHKYIYIKAYVYDISHIYVFAFNIIDIILVCKVLCFFNKGSPIYLYDFLFIWNVISNVFNNTM